MTVSDEPLKSVVLELHSVRTLHLRLLGSNFAPISGEDGPVALLKGFVHGTFGFLARVAVDLMKETRSNAVTTKILGSFVPRLRHIVTWSG